MSERGRDPQIVATALLGDARMIEACASHDIQTVIRLMRSRGASLRGLASVTGMSPGRIYEYEVGDRQANGFEAFERISDGFRIPGRCPRLADRPWERAEVRRRPCQRRPVRRSLLDPLLRRSRAGRCAGGRLLELAQEHPDQPRYGRQAEALIERALKLRRPESRRSTSLDQAGLAQTHFIQRELEQAASAGHRAIDVAEQTQSDRVRLQLQDLYRSAVAHRREAAVRDLPTGSLPCCAPERVKWPRAAEAAVTRIAVTGHMNLTAGTEILIGTSLHELLPAESVNGLVGISCLARGADQIFAQVVLALGGQLVVVLPAADYRERKVAPDNQGRRGQVFTSGAELR